MWISIMTKTNFVGPVLQAGATSEAIIAAIKRLNSSVKVLNRGSYLRVQTPGRCVVTRAAIEESLGRPFRIPSDLEKVMPSFEGALKISSDEIVWTLGG